MRGSPLIRFFLLSLLLIAAGIGLQRLTRVREPLPQPSAPTAERGTAKTLSVPYRLQLSSTASSVELSSGDFKTSALTGSLPLDAEHPQIFLTVKWQAPPTTGELRFAKLTLEPAGRSTLTHTFDASGDIDDVFEPTLSSSGQ
ncbi:MAG: hypothetical protein QM627_04760 [Luteolibacter sp.]